MTVDDLRTLLDYHYWARDRMLAALEGLTAEQYTRSIESSFRSIQDTVVHIYADEWAWYSRWLGRSPTSLLQSQLFPDVPAIRTAWTELEAQVRAFVHSVGEGGPSRVIDYKLLSGQAGSSPFWQMLQHVVNHASYHRGQVTTMLRQVGAAVPQPTDMIAFYRLQR